jgi:prepilin-type N-terminal cleavage/methylation domain-containing protein
MIKALTHLTLSWRFRKDALTNERGMTLIELMVATMVFAVISASTMIALGGALNLNRNDRNRSIGANLAAARMDELRSASFEDITIGQETQTKMVDTVGYLITTDTEWSAINASTSSCDAPNASTSAGGPRVLRATVLVEWANMSGVKPVKSQTLIAPPLGTYDPMTGHISVKVVDRLGVGAGSHDVTITKSTGGSEMLTTTSEGCAFFEGLVPGNYTVTLNTPGHVDVSLVPTPSRTVGVTAGFASNLTFQYDQAGSLQLTLSGESGYAIPTGIEAVIYSAALQAPSTTKVYANSGSGLTITGLFPFTPDGYQTWGGACQDADPLGKRPALAGRFYPDAVREPSIFFEPGATGVGNIVLKSVDVQVVNGSGVPRSGRIVQAVHVTGTEYGCPAAKTLNVGTTDATGQLKVAMPYGAWEFRVTGGTANPLWPRPVLSPTTANPQAVQVVIQ